MTVGDSLKWLNIACVSPMDALRLHTMWKVIDKKYMAKNKLSLNLNQSRLFLSIVDIGPLQTRADIFKLAATFPVL